jgi:hypothetical protein
MTHHDEHEEVHLPAPSVWPVVVGAGVSLGAFGVVTTYALSALGVVLLAWGLSGWIGELRHAHD